MATRGGVSRAAAPARHLSRRIVRSTSGLRHARSPPDLAESSKRTEEERQCTAAGIRVGHKPDCACNAIGEGAFCRPLEMGIDPPRGENPNRRENELHG